MYCFKHKQLEEKGLFLAMLNCDLDSCDTEVSWTSAKLLANLSCTGIFKMFLIPIFLFVQTLDSWHVL